MMGRAKTAEHGRNPLQKRSVSRAMDEGYPQRRKNVTLFYGSYADRLRRGRSDRRGGFVAMADVCFVIRGFASGMVRLHYSWARPFYGASLARSRSS